MNPAHPTSSGAVPTAPAPRRARSGEVLVGPTVMARYLPGVLIGLPLMSVLLSPLAAAGLQQWRRGRLRAGYETAVEQVLASAWTQLLAGALLLWVLFALWAIVPMLLTHRVVRFDMGDGALRLRRGLRTADTAHVSEVVYAVGEAERGSLALIGLRDADGSPASEGTDPPPRQWVVPEIGWDAESFDGLRVLQEAAGLRAAPQRAVLVAHARRERRLRRHRELALRLGMPWREQYEHDEAAFQAEFDRVRRVLGGKEPPREGDPVP